MSTDKQEILEAVKLAAKENGGIPLGTILFEQKTGIRPYDWGKYWVRFSDLVSEAGFEPNRKALEAVYSTDELIEQVIGTMRRLRRLPLHAELRIEKTQNTRFPLRAILKRLFPKRKLAQTVIEYAKSKSGYEDIVEMAEPILAEEDDEPTQAENVGQFGEVYLFKSGRYYKIGKTTDTVRRGAELRIQLPEKIDLIHSIKTDDPSGIETYWHRRFESKRMNGEWFNLSSTEIKAFKRWKKIL